MIVTSPARGGGAPGPRPIRVWPTVPSVDWHREHFYPLEDREQSVVYEEVLAVRQELRDAEDRAYDRFLNARAVLVEGLRAERAD